MRGRGDLRRYIRLPAELHKSHPKWTPPVYLDEWSYYNPKKNRSFGYSDAILYLAWRDRKAIGRIMGIINHRANEYRKEKNARFAWLECPNEPEVAHALLASVEDWARARGMESCVGPLGFTDQEPEGLVIEGFDKEPTIATNYNFPWLVDLVESAGYEKDVDYFVYHLSVVDNVHPRYARICRRLAERGGYRLVEFRKRRELKTWVRRILALMNESFVDIYGYAPLDQVEMDELAKKYIPLLDPRFVKLVEQDGTVLAFIIAMPNIDEGLRRSRGHLFPFGVLHILSAMKRSKQLDLLLGAIKPGFRGRGLDAMLATAIMKSARDSGFETIDTHLELEGNTLVRAEMLRFEAKAAKKYRVYKKALQPPPGSRTRTPPPD
ncbi:MAG: hypothetical protein JSU73_09605 [candidate division WOR-3 bacterium]|nr:MAG: hypothetical protein JSU73_09605 [candidate division WOR-3 bacterium]